MNTRLLKLGAAAWCMPLAALAAHGNAPPGGAPPNSAEVVRAGAPAPAPQAQAADVLTLRQALGLAIAANPDLRSAALGVAVAAALRTQAGLLPNPELSVSREGVDKATRTQTVQLSQRLELGGKRAARIGVAESERRLTQWELAIADAQLRADVVTAYFDALTAQQRVELAQASLQVARKASLAAQRRVAAGRISPVEQSRSRVAESGVQLEVAQARLELSLAQRRLAALWGDTSGVERALEQQDAGAFALPSFEALRAQLDAGARMQRAHQQLEREEARVKLERAQRIPDVSVVLGSKRDNEAGRSQAVLGLSVPLPLFNRNQGNELAALRQVDRARSELDAERVRVTQALAEAYQRASLAESELASMKQDILPAAQGAYDAAVSGFELGKFGFLDVLDAQRTLFQARAQYLRALGERCRAAADIGRYVPFGPGWNPQQ